jgi:hypothetical protein
MNENTTNIDERLDVQKMLVVKLQGPKNAIIAFLHDLPKIVLESKMNISPILKNSEDNNVHCFVNIVLDQSPVQSLQAAFRKVPTDDSASQG